MRLITDALQAHLESELCHLALLVKVSREDGQIMRFTSLDQPILFKDEDGLGYYWDPGAGLQTTGISQNAGGAVDNFQALGQIDNDQITNEDLIAGIYNNARIEAWVIEFTDLAAGLTKVLVGRFGDTTINDGVDSFSVDFRAEGERMNRKRGKLVSATCRAKFCDAACGLNEADFRVHREINHLDATEPKRIIYFTASTEADDFFSHGKVTFTTGKNKGIPVEVKFHTNLSGIARLELQEELPFAPALTDEADLVRGCDFTFTTCVQIFDNALRFRGEPKVPGTDQVLTPGRP